MNEWKVNRRAFDLFDSGFNCAESVFRSIVETVDEAGAREMTKIASAYAGGVGGTRDELCGALAGGIMAVGYLMGRTEPGADIQRGKDIAAALRRCFLDKYGTTRCGEVLDSLGPQENSLKCKDLSGDIAGELYRILKENGCLGTDS